MKKNLSKITIIRRTGRLLNQTVPPEIQTGGHFAACLIRLAQSRAVTGCWLAYRVLSHEAFPMGVLNI